MSPLPAERSQRAQSSIPGRRPVLRNALGAGMLVIGGLGVDLLASERAYRLGRHFVPYRSG